MQSNRHNRLSSADLELKNLSSSELIREGISHASVQNKRAYFEDRVHGMAFDSLETLTPAQWFFTLSSTIRELQSRTSWRFEESGSTACSVVAENAETLHVCHIGDSSAFLVIADKDGKTLPLKLEAGVISENTQATCDRFISLNKPHKPEIAAGQNKKFTEKERKLYPESYYIVAGGGCVTQKEKGASLRTNGCVNMSRALGSLNTYCLFENRESSLFHSPSIEHFRIRWSEDWEKRGLKAYVILVTDGVTDAYEFSAEKLADTVGKHAPSSLATNGIVSDLLQLGVDGSSDNVTACCMVLSPHFSKPRSAIVADGHGGSAVADYVIEHFYPILADHLKMNNKIDKHSQLFKTVNDSKTTSSETKDARPGF